MAERVERASTPTAAELARAARPTLVEYQAITVSLHSDGVVTARHMRMDPGTRKMITTGLAEPDPVEDCDTPLAHALAEAAVEWLDRTHGQLPLRY